MGSASLERVATPTTGDTIDAEPSDPYVLAVINGDGSPVVGTTVTFRASNAGVAPPGSAFGSSSRQVTDSRGEVAVVLRFGQVVGSGSVVATVPTIRAGDTLELDVRPGATVGPSLTVSDTTVLAGDGLRVSAAPVDRHGNATGPPLPVRVESGAITVHEGAYVATGVGEGRFSASLDGSTARAVVRVVPDGEIAYTSGSQAWLTRFDGSETRRLDFTVPAARERSISWNDDGDRVVVGGRPGYVVYDIVDGTVLPSAWPVRLAGSDVIWPRFGPGDTVHYSASDGGGWDIRAMGPDGSNPKITIPSARFPNNDFFPDWAPDGRRFVFTADWEERNRFLLRISNPMATVITTIYVEGVTPVWSPDGALIAYQEQGTVGVVSPDGSVMRSWDLGWSKGVTWSPQSDMLVGVVSGRVAVLDVTTGDTVVLSDLPERIDAVAWRPEPAS